MVRLHLITTERKSEKHTHIYIYFKHVNLSIFYLYLLCKFLQYQNYHYQDILCILLVKRVNKYK